MLRLCFLPEGEVSLVVLLTHTSQFTALVLDVLQGASTQDTIMIFLIICLYVEIDRTVRLVGKTVVYDLLHQLLLLDDMPGGMRLDRGRQHVQRLHCLVIAVGIILGDLHRLQLLQPCLLGNLVLSLVGIMLQVPHIRDVTDIAYLIA